MSDLSSLQTDLGYQFENTTLLQRAVSHRSAGGEHNERLEFLGDSLVNMAVAELLYNRLPDSNEGGLSATRSLLVCQSTLADVARQLNLGAHLRLGQGTSKSGGHRLDSILSDTYEALIGAVYLDSGWPQVQIIVTNHFSEKIENIGDLNQARDAKSRLQELLQAKRLALPLYELIDTSGPGHSQQFKVRCVLETLSGDFVGEGSSRRKAEQQAAENALKALESEHGS